MIYQRTPGDPYDICTRNDLSSCLFRILIFPGVYLKDLKVSDAFPEFLNKRKMPDKRYRFSCAFFHQQIRRVYLRRILFIHFQKRVDGGNADSCFQGIFRESVSGQLLSTFLMKMSRIADNDCVVVDLLADNRCSKAAVCTADGCPVRSDTDGSDGYWFFRQICKQIFNNTVFAHVIRSFAC